jgi:hypothetical protein
MAHRSDSAHGAAARSSGRDMWSGRADALCGCDCLGLLLLERSSTARSAPSPARSASRSPSRSPRPRRTTAATTGQIELVAAACTTRSPRQQQAHADARPRRCYSRAPSCPRNRKAVAKGRAPWRASLRREFTGMPAARRWQTPKWSICGYRVSGITRPPGEF